MDKDAKRQAQFDPGQMTSVRQTADHMRRDFVKTGSFNTHDLNYVLGDMTKSGVLAVKEKSPLTKFYK
jgi:DNA replication initiation complex subunit (GINS family)